MSASHPSELGTFIADTFDDLSKEDYRQSAAIMDKEQALRQVVLAYEGALAEAATIIRERLRTLAYNVTYEDKAQLQMTFLAALQHEYVKHPDAMVTYNGVVDTLASWVEGHGATYDQNNNIAVPPSPMSAYTVFLTEEEGEAFIFVPAWENDGDGLLYVAWEA